MASGCSSEKQQEKTAVNNAQQTQTAIKPAETEKFKTDVVVKTPAQPEKTYRPTKARSKQNVVATFEVGSKNCVINGKSVTMEAPLLSKEVYFISIPAGSFALAIGIPNGEYKLSRRETLMYLESKGEHQMVAYDVVTVKRGNKTVSGTRNYLYFEDKSFPPISGEMAYIDSSGVAYVRFNSFAKVFGYDMHLDEDTGIVELFQGLPLEESDLVIASLKPGVKNENQLVSLLGKPDKVNKHRIGGYKDLFYADFEVHVQAPENGEGDVLSITTTSSKYKTKRGITVGDKIEKVLDLYGMGYYFNKTQNCYYYTFLTTMVDHEKFVAFQVEDNIVKAIKVGDYVIP